MRNSGAELVDAAESNALEPQGVDELLDGHEQSSWRHTDLVELSSGSDSHKIDLQPIAFEGSERRHFCEYSVAGYAKSDREDHNHPRRGQELPWQAWMLCQLKRSRKQRGFVWRSWLWNGVWGLRWVSFPLMHTPSPGSVPDLMTHLMQGCEVAHRVFRSKGGLWFQAIWLMVNSDRRNPWSPLPPLSWLLLLWHWPAERHHLGWQRFHPPVLSMDSQASMALWRSIRLMTDWPWPDIARVSTSTHWACAVGMSLRKQQTFPCWSFTNHPTPFFGAWRSTSGWSLFGIWPLWRNRRWCLRRNKLYDWSMASFFIISLSQSSFFTPYLNWSIIFRCWRTWRHRTFIASKYFSVSILPSIIAFCVFG